MKDQLSSLKDKLDSIEKLLEDKVGEAENRDLKYNSYEERVKAIKEQNAEDIIWINVGGKKFATTMSTLTNVKDNLFHKIIISKKLDLKKGIFIDRSPGMFTHILDYFRYKKINYKRFSVEELVELKEEAIYYEVLQIENDLDYAGKDAKYVKVEVNAWYYDSIGLVGNQDVQTLLDKNLTTGICTTSPGWLTIELDKAHLFEDCEIGGYTGRSDWVYEDGYGAGASIETSEDKIKWNNVGSIPHGFGTKIMSLKLTRSNAKYIKFTGTGWIGLGYFKISTGAMLKK